MALFGLFGKSRPSLDKHAKRCANRRAQAPDRWESIQLLGQVAAGELEAKGDATAADAVAALLVRFTYNVDPSITDGEEKDEVFRWLSRSGDAAIEPIRRALRLQDNPNWALRILRQLVDEERVTAEIISVLSEMDTEYVRDPQKKISLLAILEEREQEGIIEAVLPFLQDVNESARFHAVGAVLSQPTAESALDSLRGVLTDDAEDSLRIKTRVVEAMMERGWSVGDEVTPAHLPEGYRVGEGGVPAKAAPPAEPKPTTGARPAASASSKRRSPSAGKRRRRR